jgi:hypothetical protein
MWQSVTNGSKRRCEMQGNKQTGLYHCYDTHHSEYYATTTVGGVNFIILISYMD